MTNTQEVDNMIQCSFLKATFNKFSFQSIKQNHIKITRTCSLSCSRLPINILFDLIRVYVTEYINTCIESFFSVVWYKKCKQAQLRLTFSKYISLCFVNKMFTDLLLLKVQ